MGGRSAGAMVAGADATLTIEIDPNLWAAMGFLHQGLGLVGTYTIRPHYTRDTWDRASEVYEETLGLNVVRMPNGEGLMCSGNTCKMVGMKHAVEWGRKGDPPKITVDEDHTNPHHEGSSP